DAWDEINTRILSNEVRPYLTFATIPWPVLRLSSDPQLKESNEITLEDTREFLLSPFHSPEKNREGRLRDARIRWSTSRSPSWLAFVVAADRERALMQRLFRCLKPIARVQWIRQLQQDALTTNPRRGPIRAKQWEPWKSPLTWTLAVIPFFTFGLGTWQVQRLQWKNDLVRRAEEELAKEPVALPDYI
ncbi:12447_t:CDS:2, partial [Acaulospora colombiana]